MADAALLIEALKSMDATWRYDGQGVLQSLSEDSLMVAENLAAEEDDTPELRHWEAYTQSHMREQTAMFATIRAALAGERVETFPLLEACRQMGRFIQHDIDNTRQNIAFVNEDIDNVERFNTSFAFLASMAAELAPGEEPDAVGRAVEALFSHDHAVLTDQARAKKMENRIQDDIKNIEKDTDHLAWLVSLRDEWNRQVAPLLPRF